MALALEIKESSGSRSMQTEGYLHQLGIGAMPFLLHQLDELLDAATPYTNNRNRISTVMHLIEALGPDAVAACPKLEAISRRDSPTPSPRSTRDSVGPDELREIAARTLLAIQPESVDRLLTSDDFFLRHTAMFKAASLGRMEALPELLTRACRDLPSGSNHYQASVRSLVGKLGSEAISVIQAKLPELTPDGCHTLLWCLPDTLATKDFACVAGLLLRHFDPDVRGATASAVLFRVSIGDNNDPSLRPLLTRIIGRGYDDQQRAAASFALMRTYTRAEGESRWGAALSLAGDAADILGGTILRKMGL